MRRTNLRGHALRSEGKPYILGGEEHELYVRNAACRWGGVALCECGQVSGWLISDNKRKLWHRDHKNDVRTDE